MGPFRVVIARFPGDGWEHSGLCTWLMRTFHELKEDPRVSDPIGVAVYSDTPITMTRNRAVRDALAAGADYLLMVDSDVVPDYLVGVDPLARRFWPTAWGWMMHRRWVEGACRRPDGEGGGDEGGPGAWPRPATIASPYCGPPPQEQAFVFRWKDWESDTPNPNFRLEMIEREDAAMRTGIERVAALATGLILYDLRLFDELPRPWFDYEYDDAGTRAEKVTTEDVYQTRHASLLGLPQFVLWDSWSQHVKEKPVGKPRVLTNEGVAEGFAEALLRNHRRGRHLHFASRHDGAASACGDSAEGMRDGG